MHTRVWKDNEYKGIDPGIRFAVRVLHAAGIETCQSCEGGGVHSYPEPTVDLPAADDVNGFAALSALASYGLPVDTVSITWTITNGLPVERLWRITFARKMTERANDRPIFVHGYEPATAIRSSRR